jgi:3-deoxy-D-manno-octulosonic-acid transferase
MAFFTYIYSQIIFPMGWIIALLASFISKKIRQMFIDRTKSIKPPQSVIGKNAIWFHCASGEFEYARSIIKIIKSKNPDQAIVVSYMSPSFKKVIESDANVDFSFPLPWDFYLKQKEILKLIAPKVVLIARTDFWPQFLKCCKLLKIKTIAFSVRAPEGANFMDRLLLKLRMHGLSQILTVSESDTKILNACGIASTTLGDSRWDRVQERLNQPSKVKDSVVDSLTKLKPILVCGSTWPSDEQIIANVFSQGTIKNSYTLVIAPHEVDQSHILKLKTALQSKGLNTKLYSESEALKRNEVLIVDKVGLLADFYRLADVSFVGGSFGRSVHSVMEPLGAGTPVIVGPDHLKSREAVEFKSLKGTEPIMQLANKSIRLLNVVHTSNQFKSVLLELLRADQSKLRAEIAKQTQQRLGASARILAHVERLI